MISEVFIVFLAAYAAYTVMVMGEPVKRLVYVTPREGSGELEPIMSSFTCLGRSYGYFTDIENDCFYFHICHKVYRRDGSWNMVQATFKCPNETVFNQELLSCDWEDFSSPCFDSDFDSNKRFTTPEPFYQSTTTPGPIKKLFQRRKQLNALGM